MILLQAIENNIPRTYLYRLVELGQDETANGLLQAIVQAFREDGLEKFMKQQLVGYTADGAATMVWFIYPVDVIFDIFGHPSWKNLTVSKMSLLWKANISVG